MSKLLEQIKGYLKAFAVINDGNNEESDYLIDEVETNGNLIPIYTKPNS